MITTIAPGMLTQPEAAVVAQRSLKTIQRAVLSGDLPSQKVGRGRGERRIWVGDLATWLLARLDADPTEELPGTALDARMAAVLAVAPPLDPRRAERLVAILRGEPDPYPDMDAQRVSA